VSLATVRRAVDFDHAAAAHLHRRAGFGAKRATIEASVTAGLDATVDGLLARRAHDPALHAGIRRLLGTERIDSVQAWWLALILGDRAPLVERVTLMWHDHFATSNDKVRDARMMHAQNELFRAHGLGDFRSLMHRVAKDPAMLVWLDGGANRVGEPNENFAREVLELFALGLGNYTERDVQELARAFTGWGVEKRAFVGRPAHHDPREKHIFGHRGRFGGEEALDLVLAQPACPRHVARRLLAEFVEPEPRPEDVEAWARVLVEEDWDVAAFLTRLLRSELFFSGRARRSRIAGPIEWVARTALELGARVVPADALAAVTAMGQAPLRPPSVKGWDGGRTWIHAGSWLARTEFASALVFDAGRFDAREALGRPAPEATVEAALERLLPGHGPAPALVSALEDAAAASPDADVAARRVLALLLTAPEAHLA